jgi:type VI secretion system protein ImpA
MAGFDFAGLSAAISEAEPCGPDLDLAGDADYMNFVARAEGVLPATFFSGPEGKPFDRTSIDFAAEFAGFAPLLERTRDLRLFALLAKFLILNRDIAGFVGCVALIDTLLKDRWEAVHPQAFDGDFGVRTAALESLDDMPPVVFPLQYLPLFTHRRLGPVTYRAWMIATGEAKPREGEEIHDVAAIDTALLDVELETLVERRDQFKTLQEALTGIRETCVDQLGAGQAVKLERLPGLAAKIGELLERVVAKRDPSLATETPAATASDGTGAAGSTIPAGVVASTRDVMESLAAIAAYFAKSEPSNPALLLVRQAEQLMGKSFIEVMQALVPDQLAQAAIRIGRDHMFDLPIERLASFAEVAPPEEEQSVVQDSPFEDPPAETSTEDSSAGEESPAEESNADSPAEQPPPSPPPSAARRFEVKSRADAVRLLDQIGTYYRTAEPSSPIPFLTERARSFAERDFLSVLKELLPEGALRGPASAGAQ